MKAGPPAPSAHTAPSTKEHEEREPLTFLWPERSASFVLPAVFLLAVLLHAAAFYVFQIVYPPSTAVAPPTAQLLYIAPTLPENHALLQWADAQLPSTVARLRATPLPGELGPIRYEPTFLTPSTLPKAANLADAPTPYPLAYSGLRFRPTTEAPDTTESPTAPTAPAVRSSVVFSEALQPFVTQRPQDAPVPPLFPEALPADPPATAATLETSPEAIAQIISEPTATPKQPPPLHAVVSFLPTRYMVALNRRGELRYTFLQASSGDKKLDRRAVEYLQQYPFHHPQTEANEASEASIPDITWGYATFTWGAETYEPAATDIETDALPTAATGADTP